MSIFRIIVLIFAVLTQAVTAVEWGAGSPETGCGKSCCPACLKTCHCQETPESPNPPVPGQVPTAPTREGMAPAAQPIQLSWYAPSPPRLEATLPRHSTDQSVLPGLPIRRSLLFCSFLI